MRKLLFCSLALIAAGPAVAADLPTRTAAPYTAPVVVVVPTWTGFYIGANGGFASGHVDGGLETSPCATGCPVARDLANFPGDSNVGISGGFGGGQIGYNWQTGQIVWGVETDFQGASIRGSDLFDGHAWPGGWEWDKQIDTKVDWFGTVRARVGYDFAGWLPYVTGGLAYGHDRMSEAVTQHSGTGGPVYNSGVGSFDETRVGWTAGAGIEYAFTRNWSAKFEYLHVDLGNKNSVFTGNMLTPAGTYAGAWAQDGLNSRLDFDAFRIGVNYRFF